MVLLGYQLINLGVIYLAKFLCTIGVFRKKWQLDRRLQALPIGIEYWFHGASLGEVKALYALSRRLRLNEEKTLFTSQTQSAYAWLVEQKSNIKVEFFPLDNKGLMGNIWPHLRSVFLFEGEFWPHLFQGIQKSNAQLHWINPTEKSFARAQKSGYLPATVYPYFKGEIGNSSLPCFDLKLANVSVYFSKVQQPKMVLISVHKEEIQLLKKMFAGRGNRDLSCILIPRYPKEAPLFKKVFENSDFGFKVEDRMGCVLQHLQGAGYALVGGGWCAKGLHNYFEPLSLGIPTIVGRPNRGDENFALLVKHSFLYPYQIEQDPLPSLEIFTRDFDRENLRAWFVDHKKRAENAIQFIRDQIEKIEPEA